MTRLIQRIKKDPGYIVDPRLGPVDLGVEARRRMAALLRAQWSLRRVKGGRLRFAERSIQVRHRRHLRIGTGSVVEAHATLHCLSRDGFRIGNRVTIGKFAILEASGVLWNLGKGLQIGDDSSVGDYCFIGASGGVTIGDDVLMGQRVSIHSQNHNYSRIDIPMRDQGVTHTGVVIEDDCWLGSGSVILDGVTIGAGSIVAAGAVVSRSCPPRSILAGVPAKVIGQRGGS